MDKKNIYCIKFEIPHRESGISSSQFFKGIEECLIGFEDFNQAIIKGFSQELKVVSYIEEVEQGSIKIWIRDVLKDKITDDNIRDLTGSIATLPFFLIKAKKIALKYLNDDSLENEDKKECIYNSIVEEKNKINKIELLDQDIDKDALLTSINHISKSISNIGEASFLDEKEKEIKINGGFYYSSDEKEIIITEPQVIIAHIVVHSPVYDKKTKIWKFTYNGKHEKIDISGCNIYQTIDSRGGALIGDTFKVKLEITEKKNKHRFTNHYKIIEVLEFKPTIKKIQDNLI